MARAKKVVPQKAYVVVETYDEYEDNAGLPNFENGDTYTLTEEELKNSTVSYEGYSVFEVGKQVTITRTVTVK